MRSRSIASSSLALVTLMAALLAGCGGPSRVVIEGYPEAELNRKKIVLLLPEMNDLVMNNSSVYAASRGVTTEGAREALRDELRTSLSAALGVRLDSNTVTAYRDETVSGIVTLDATDDLNAGTPKSWDKFNDAARQGNIDFFLVITRFSVANTPPATTGAGRGDETVNATFSLLDPVKRRVMTTGAIEFTAKDPRVPADTYTRLADELTRKLPFHVKAGS